MPIAVINYLAVLVAAASSMVIGFVWYHPAVFGKQWMKAMGKSESQLKKEAASKPYMYPAMFVASLVMSYVLAHIVFYTESVTFMDGALAGFWAWLGFVVTTAFTDVLFENKSQQLYMLKIGFYLVTMVVMGGILAMWM